MANVHAAERKVNVIFNTFHHAQNMRREIRALCLRRFTYMRRKLKKLAVMVKNGKRDYLSVRNMFKGWAASYYKIMSKVQRQNMDDLFNSLFEKEESEYENALQIRPEYRQIYWCGAC